MQPIRVLVIEDSALYERLIKALLDVPEKVFDVVAVHRLSAGLEELARGRVHVVLLDLNLPDSDGIETFERVQAAAPELPIVVLTGVDDEQTAAVALRQGAQDYLVKGPINSELLSRSLRYAIERKRFETELQRAHDELELRVEQRTAELRAAQEAARLQQEQLAHVSRLNTLGELASGLAHELNQPLTAILGFTDVSLQLARDNARDPERLESILSDAAAEAKRAAEIIKRLRKLVGRRPPERDDVAVNTLVRETMQLLRPAADVHVELELASDLPRITGDRVQIQQVLLNLANNALQSLAAAETRDKRLTVATRADSQSVEVEVIDNGAGIAPEDMKRLFEPFFTRKPDGLGLGLSISRSIVESHAGTMSAEPNEDGGLTFRFRLPLSGSA